MLSNASTIPRLPNQHSNHDSCHHVSCIRLFNVFIRFKTKFPRRLSADDLIFAKCAFLDLVSRRKAVSKKDLRRLVQLPPALAAALSRPASRARSAAVVVQAIKLCYHSILRNNPLESSTALRARAVIFGVSTCPPSLVSTASRPAHVIFRCA